MAEYVFDCETDGLLDKLTRVHSLVLKDRGTDEVFSFRNDGHPDNLKRLEDGVRMLMEADLIIGHNIIGFDLKALHKVFPWFTWDNSKVFDTLVATRLIWADVKDKDLQKIRSGKIKMPMQLAGRHSLEAWGWRLGNWKGDYAKERADYYLDFCKIEGLPDPTEDEIADFVWRSWSKEMQEYCEQDVAVTDELYDLIVSKGYSKDSLDLEHEVAWICDQQETNGYGFDVEKAEALYQSLLIERIELEDKLRSLFPPWWTKDGKNTKVWKRTMRMKDGTVRFAGEEYTPVKQVIFNPGSRDHVADRLMKVRGWKPVVLTEGGKPAVDEKVLSELPYPEAKQLAHFYQVNKLLGQLSDGDNAWLKFVKNGSIHGRINPNGAVTGRATHSKPNVGQVPSFKAYRGPECRELWHPITPDHVQVGCDVSGLELRMLAHFMAKFDDGAYGLQVVEGDVHWVTVQTLGLVPEGTERDEVAFKVHKVFRDGAKTFIYGFLYGAGDEKIGTLILEIAMAEEEKVGENTTRAKYFNGKRKVGSRDRKAVGRKLKAAFLESLPALKNLINGVEKTVEAKGNLKGLDGRILNIRSSHAALNTLLQSAGALVCKRWLVEFHRLLKEKGIPEGDVLQMAWVHDEVQLSVHRKYNYTVVVDGKEETRNHIGDLCVEAIKRAGEHFKIRVQLDGEYKVGANWRECH